MADNTGLNQAVVVYRVRASDNAPLDVDGKPISETGKKQAIAVLIGTANPNPALYEIQFTYSADASVGGVPTVRQSLTCKTGYIFLSETAQIVLQTSAPTHSILLTSSAAWVLSSSPVGIATIDRTAGVKGQYSLTLTRTATLGQGYYVFTNSYTGQTARIYVVNTLAPAWILATGAWNNNGFWYSTSLWKFNP